MIHSLSGCSSQTLHEQHQTAKGQPYTLNYNSNMVLDAQFKGQGKSNANAQGWGRDSKSYWQQMSQQHPEMFSLYNQRRISEGKAPLVDRKMINSVPEYASYKGEGLRVHHIGGDGEQLGIPDSMHKGSGVVHNHEKKAGITQRNKEFSAKCQNELNNHPQYRNMKASDFRNQLQTQQNPPAPQNKSNTSKQAASSKANAVRAGGQNNTNKQGNQSAPSKANAVRAGGQNNTNKQGNQAAPSKANAVRASGQNNTNKQGNQAAPSKANAVRASGQNNTNKQGNQAAPSKANAVRASGQNNTNKQGNQAAPSKANAVRSGGHSPSGGGSAGRSAGGGSSGGRSAGSGSSGGSSHGHSSSK